MSRKGTQHTAVWAGAFVAAAASIWIELLSFRLTAATLGAGFAFFVAVLVPATGAWGAATIGARPALASRDALTRRASVMIACTAVSLAVSLIGLTWVMDVLAKRRAESSWLHVAVVLSGWVLTGTSLGAATALLLRRAAGQVGRMCFVLAAGSAAGCLLIPIAMWAGAPRASLALVTVLGLVSVWMAMSVRDLRPTMALQPLLTLPLAGVALLAGDFGKPWLRVRLDYTKRRNITMTEWTEQGAVAVDRPRRGRTNYTVDQSASLRLHTEQRSKPTPGFLPQDFGYALTPKTLGAVLVIGSGGARAVRAAIARGYPGVDTVEPSAAVAHDVVNGRFGQTTGHILGRSPRVTLRIGAGRAQLIRLRSSYQRIVVVGEPPLTQAALRLLARTDELFTVAAIKSYLERLDPVSGNLVLRVHRDDIPAVMASVERAVGDRVKARERMVACRQHDRWGVLMVRRKPFDARTIHKLKKFCKRKRLSLYYPPEKIRKGDRKQGAKKKKKIAKLLAELDAASPLTDDRPFFRPTPASLVASMTQSLRALQPQKNKKKPKKKKKSAIGTAADDPKPPVMSEAGIAIGGAAVAALLWLLLLLTPIPRRLPGDPSLPVTARLAIPFYGLALALGLFAVTHHALRWLGDAHYAWTLVVPLALVGAGSGRLWADVVDRHRFFALAVGAAGIAGLFAAFMLAPMLAPGAGSLQLRLAGAIVLMLVVGWLLGAPIGAVLKLSSEQHGDPAIAWIWGAHLIGWVFGGAVAVLGARYFGLSTLFTLAAIALGLATMLFAVGSFGRRGLSATD